MAVSKDKKREILGQLESNLKVAKSVSFTSNKGLTVAEITELRRNLRKVSSKFMLAKKTLIKIAFKNVYGTELDDSLLEGQIAVLTSNDDPLAGMSTVNKKIKEQKKGEDKIKFAGAYFEGRMLSAKEATQLADLPSRETLLAKMLGSMMSPLSSLARFFDGAQKELESKNLQSVGNLKDSVKKEEVKEEPKQEARVEETKTEETPVTTEEPKTEETTEEA